MRKVWFLALAGALLLGPTAARAQTMFEEAKLLPSDGEPYAAFGTSVAIYQLTAVVGAPWDLDVNGKTGSAYVFEYAGGAWQEQDKLLATDGAVLDKFGASAALDDDTAVVGAPFHDHNGSNSGAAYVFVRAGGVWIQEAKLLPSDGAADDEFGNSASVDGDTIVLGAFGVNNHMGSAYVFGRAGTVWNLQAKLTAPDGNDVDGFGNAVAVDGDTIAIGSPWDDDNGLQSGSVFVYDRTSGPWVLRAKLLASDGAASARFGYSVALDGDTIVVGADSDGDNGPGSGSVYVFVRTGDAWTQQAKLLASDGAVYNYFGTSVAVDGDLAVIGAEQAGSSGSAYAFDRLGDAWTERVKLISSDGAIADYFGASVAVESGRALVGAPTDNDHGADSGSAYVYLLDEGGDGGVPAVGGFGAVMTLLAVAAIGIYFVRRRAH